MLHTETTVYTYTPLTISPSLSLAPSQSHTHTHTSARGYISIGLRVRRTSASRCGNLKMCCSRAQKLSERFWQPGMDLLHLWFAVCVQPSVRHNSAVPRGFAPVRRCGATYKPQKKHTATHVVMHAQHCCYLTISMERVESWLCKMNNCRVYLWILLQHYSILADLNTQGTLGGDLTTKL